MRVIELVLVDCYNKELNLCNVVDMIELLGQHYVK